MLTRVVSGDPGWGTVNAEEELRSYLRDPVLTTHDDVVHVGYVGGEAVAFTAAQVRPTNGWGRITYLGVVPEHRGRGLGRWCHRHGFTMLRSQGGSNYEGGTDVLNQPMCRLFEVHGCERFRVEIEWRWVDAR